MSNDIDQKVLKKGDFDGDFDEIKVLAYLNCNAQNRSYLVKESSSTTLRLTCSNKDKEKKCEWRINARKHGFFIKITKCLLEHTCKESGRKRRFPRKVLKNVGDIYENFVPISGQGNTTAQLIEMFKEKGVEIGYNQANRLINDKRDNLEALSSAQYQLLPALIKNYKQADMQGDYIIQLEDAGDFNRLFFAPNCAQQLWKYSRRLLNVNCYEMNNRFNHYLFTASVNDAANEPQLIAFSIASKNSAENWKWFFLICRSTFGDVSTIFTSQEFVDIAMTDFINNENFVVLYDMHVFIKYFKRKFKHTNDMTADCCGLIKKCMNSITDDLYEINISMLKESYPNVATLLNTHKDKFIASKLFEENQTTRYNEVISHNMQDINIVIGNQLSSPVCDFIQHLMGTMRSNFEHRIREGRRLRKLGQAITDYTKDYVIQLHKEASDRYRVEQTYESLTRRGFHVHDNLPIDIVHSVHLNIENSDEPAIRCSCKQTLATGLPCIHAIEALFCLSQKYNDEKWNPMNPLWYMPIYHTKTYIKQYACRAPLVHFKLAVNDVQLMPEILADNMQQVNKKQKHTPVRGTYTTLDHITNVNPTSRNDITASPTLNTPIIQLPSTAKRKCTVCKALGHNARTCNQRFLKTDIVPPITEDTST